MPFERCAARDSNRPLRALRSRGARSLDVDSSASTTLWSTLEAEFALAWSPTHLLSCAGRRTGGLTDLLARQRALSAVETAPTSAATRDDKSIVNRGVVSRFRSRSSPGSFSPKTPGLGLIPAVFGISVVRRARYGAARELGPVW